MLRDFQISELRALWNSVAPSILRKKPHFGRLHLWSHSFGHYLKFINIDENWDKSCFENWELCLFRYFSFHDYRIVQSSHYWTSLANSGMKFFVLPSVTRKCNPKLYENEINERRAVLCTNRESTVIEMLSTDKTL